MKEYFKKYDVAVIGAGHAGCEAALAAARMGMKTVCFTLNLDSIALMPCNPSVGGPAKGHLVSEIDALGGEMGKNTDLTAVQLRVLNSSKGPAVRSLRAQSDKKQYQKRMKIVMQNQENLDLREALITDILVREGAVKGIVTETEIIYYANAVILASGTYLAAKNIIGSAEYESGPHNERTTSKISECLKNLGFELDRYQTATPARIHRGSIDFSKFSELPGEEVEYGFSLKHPMKDKKQLSSWLGYTSEKTIDVIKNNLHRSPLSLGNITNKGPRYCASIDRKVINFPDKYEHQVFIEPEGFYTEEMYVQGVTTAMPEDAQEAVLRTIPGLEQIKVLRYGYAIEYDFVPTWQTRLTMESKIVENLYLAGQINGTSGYEEAAAQGLMAGINAVLKLKDQPRLVLSRNEAYIGVLIDDLINKENMEPYRLFTSRAEHRLLLRHDNAGMRLTDKGYAAGLVSQKQYQEFQKQKELFESEIISIETIRISPNAEVQKILQECGSGDLKKQVSMKEILQRPEISYKDLKKFGYEPIDDCLVARQIEIQCKYEGYIKRQIQKAKKYEQSDSIKIPENIRYSNISGITGEACEKLEHFLPETVGQMKALSGISPADINAVIEYISAVHSGKIKIELQSEPGKKRKLTNF